MITLRQRIFIVLSVIVLIILAITILLLVRYNKIHKGQTTTSTPGGASNEIVLPPVGQTPANIPEGATSKPLTTEEAQKNAAKQMAKIFMERYGSYSTDNAYANIDSVKNLVTSNLWNQLSSQVKANQTTANFVGVTSKAIVSEIDDWDNDGAKIAVGVSRQEKRNGQITTSFSNYSVEMKKVNDSWLVDSFTKTE